MNSFKSLSLCRSLAPLSLLLISLLFAATAQALSTDRDQPAEIEADDIEFDFRKGTRTYLGNVLVVQGTLRIKADKLIAIYGQDDELKTVTAWGSLARFKQRPDGKQNDVEGWAKEIVVDQQKNTLTLIGKASLKQGPDTARSSTIIYNMASDRLSLKGGAKVDAAGKDGTMPKRTLEDPFADDAQGPAAAPTLADREAERKAKLKKQQAAAKAAAEEGGEAGEVIATAEEIEEVETAIEELEEVEEVEPEPAKAGRSRLIIQPK